jgi:hypothetical protein
MRSGSPILFDIALFDNTGAGLSYANKTAFEAAGWSLAFIDMSTGLAVSPTISYSIAPVAGVTGRHVVSGITLTSAAWVVRVTPPAATWTFMTMPSVFWTGEQYDTDNIYSRVNSIYGVTSTTTIPSRTLNNLVEGDSYSTTIDIPTSYLSRMAWTDLSGTTLHGTIYRTSDDGTGTAAATLTEGADPKVSHNAVLTSFDISWTAYPSGMALTTPERTAGFAAFRVEVQAAKSGKTLTILYNSPLTVYRQDDET